MALPMVTQKKMQARIWEEDYKEELDLRKHCSRKSHMPIQFLLFFNICSIYFVYLQNYIQLYIIKIKFRKGKLERSMSLTMKLNFVLINYFVDNFQIFEYLTF